MSSTDALPRAATVAVVHPLLPPRDAQRRALARASAIRHPGLAEIIEVAEIDTGLQVSFALPFGAQPLPVDLPSSPGALVRLLAPIAAGLALLHDAECVHGAVSIASVYARSDGAGVLAPGSGSGAAADDVHDVAAILRDLLPSHSVGSDLAHLVVVGTDPDPSVRPSMARVAAILDLARRRLAPPTSPLAQRRVGTSPDPLQPGGSAKPPLSGWPVGSPHPAGSATVTRARHAAPAGRPRHRLSWRMIAALAGIAVAGVLAIGATRTSDAPLVCPAPAAATNPTPPAGWLDRSSDRSS